MLTWRVLTYRGGWLVVEPDDESSAPFRDKNRAMAHAMRQARAVHREGLATQVLISGEAGGIEAEIRYGKDPEPCSE